VAQLLRGRHRCDPAELEAYEADQLHASLTAVHAEIADYLESPAGQTQLAFARWCRENGR
jgi:hypothetical protein